MEAMSLAFPHPVKTDLIKAMEFQCNFCLLGYDSLLPWSNYLIFIVFALCLLLDIFRILFIGILVIKERLLGSWYMEPELIARIKEG